MSEFLKLTSVSGKEVYVSDVSSIGDGEYGATDLFTSNGRFYVVTESPSEVISELEKLKPSEAKTLRDEFAMVALGGILSSQGIRDIKYIGELSYEIADVMLKERSK